MKTKSYIILVALVTFIVFIYTLSKNSGKVEYVNGDDDSILQIISFNLRYGGAKDGENAWPYRRKSMFQYFKKVRPYIMGTQEGQHFQLEEIKRHVPKINYIGRVRTFESNSPTGEYSAIFYDTTKFNVIKTDTFWLSDTPNFPGTPSWDSYHPRVCTYGVFERKHDSVGTNYIVYNCHLEYRSRYARLKSMEIIQSHVEKNFPNKQVILLGDFNVESLEEDTLNYLRNNNWVECFESLNPDSDMGTFHNFTGNTGNFVGKARLDYIFVKNPVTITPKQSYIDTVKYGSQYPSDHFPLVCKFQENVYKVD